ncbi:MAG: tRNA glutamyl-Q(34) synthetase GluQRS [Rhodoferax sp.]|nr:tRNA glutamyl-Q(34) synthetase GluQRS [Rhodoferax sp.]
MAQAGYIGRFAPSPTGPLHAGSLVAALASWLDARCRNGRWLLRIEDVDAPRTVAGADRTIMQQLGACGLHPDAPPAWQSQRGDLYRAALQQLTSDGLAYACTCSRKDIETTLAAQGQTRSRHAERVYPGSCREGPLRPQAPARAWRVRTDVVLEPHGQSPGGSAYVSWHDRRLRAQTQDVTQAVGDFVLQRADHCWTYQLAVVVDDAAQGITHVVRGQDLADNTARQIWLQRCLGLPTPQYLHTPLVLGTDGAKLSKQNGAQPLDVSRPLQALNAAAAVLGWPAQNASVPEALATWIALVAANGGSPVAP